MTHESPGAEDLRRLLTDAVADVEPAHRLPAIRRRTHAGTRGAGAPFRTRLRRRLVVPATLGLAAATIAGAVLLPPVLGTVLGARDGDRAADPTGPGGPAATSGDPGPTAPGPAAVPVYYVGPAPTGPEAPDAVLYRYFEPGAPDGADALDLLTGTPSDPDYRTLWPAGSLRSMSRTPSGDVVVAMDPALRERPAGMSVTEARLAVQQVVYTVRAVTQAPVAVTFADAAGGGRVLGLDEPTTGWLPEPPLAVLSHLSISDPAEEAAYDASSGSFLARGVANSFEGTVFCRLLDTAGRSVVEAPTQHAGSWTEEVLHPWEVDVDLTDVAPGRYRLTCVTDDPTAGTEGRGQDVDTRTIDVR